MTSRPTIVVLDGGTLNPGDNPWTELLKLGDVRIYDATPPELVVPRAQGADCLIINKVRLSREHFQQLPSLKLVAVTATGYDCVDTAAAREMGIVVCNVPVYGTDSVAQHVFALLLHIIHRVDIHDRAIRDGEWHARGVFSFWKSPLFELAGKTMGIVGFGRIGRRVGHLAHAFGMEVVANSRSAGEPPDFAPLRLVSLEQLTRQSDVISLHCPATDETVGMVNRRFLAGVKPNAILLNASRGSLVVESDLADALNAGNLLAAGLDVVSREPIDPDNPLLKARNCFLTPHMAWATLEARKRLMHITAENVRAFLAGRPHNVVT